MENHLERKKHQSEFNERAKKFGPTDFITHHMMRYNKDLFNSRGYTSIGVLPELNGRPWDEIALGLVHALRPSSIRVTTGMCTLHVLARGE